MHTRRSLLFRTAPAALAATAWSPLQSATPSRLGIPGPFPGRVIAVRHPGLILSGKYQPAAVEQAMQRGMMELTGAPAWQDAWRTFFEKGDVVGIKVSPVGGRHLCSDRSVLQQIIAGLNAAGVPNSDIIVVNRYRTEVTEAGIDKWVPAGMRWVAASPKYTEIQQDMEGYDADHYMDMALVRPGQNPADAHNRRSYVAKVVTKDINKLINLPVVKHHQSAGVTVALKNMSHGLVNNVSRSHSTPTLNACGVFIPAVVNLPVIRQRAVLHIVDGVKASYHGGPGGVPQFMWEHKTMYFATDPVAVDKIAWKAIDAKRAEAGMQPVAISKPDKFSTFLNCQVEHIEIAGSLGLGMFDDKNIDLRNIQLS
jgi:hypothetical protein